VCKTPPKTHQKHGSCPVLQLNKRERERERERKKETERESERERERKRKRDDVIFFFKKTCF
jgi:hypothetical protein